MKFDVPHSDIPSKRLKAMNEYWRGLQRRIANATPHYRTAIMKVDLSADPAIVELYNAQARGNFGAPQIFLSEHLFVLPYALFIGDPQAHSRLGVDAELHQSAKEIVFKISQIGTLENDDGTLTLDLIPKFYKSTESFESEGLGDADVVVLCARILVLSHELGHYLLGHLSGAPNESIVQKCNDEVDRRLAGLDSVGVSQTSEENEELRADVLGVILTFGTLARWSREIYPQKSDRKFANLMLRMSILLLSHTLELITSGNSDYLSDRESHPPNAVRYHVMMRALSSLAE